MYYNQYAVDPGCQVYLNLLIMYMEKCIKMHAHTQTCIHTHRSYAGGVSKSHELLT